MTDPYKEETELQMLRRMSTLQEYGEYVVIDWDKDPEKLGETIGKCVTELLKCIEKSGVNVFHASEQIIIKRWEYTLEHWRNGTEPQATVAIKVLGRKEDGHTETDGADHS